MKQHTDLMLDKINTILFEHWDPIGINHDPKAPRDEYARYAPEIAELVVNKADAWEIATALREIQWKKMSLDRAIEDNMPAARLLRELK